jgi:stage II sporulation protein D
MSLRMPNLHRSAIALATALICVLTPATALAGTSSGVLVIDGAGFGHGIGMSQYGAAGYALHGRDYRFILAHYYTGTGIGQVKPSQIVRVLLQSAGLPAFSGANAAAGLRLPRGQRLQSAITYTVQANPNGTLSLSYRQGARTRRIGPLRAPLSVSGPGVVQLAGVGSYAGALVFRPAGGGLVQTVNAVDVEDYVRGVVAEEIPSSWPAQALEAQAVAARTYAITNDVAGSDFDVYPDTRSQMYGGVDAQTAATDAAVAATRGQIVTYHGAPVATYFFSSSGGHTESIQDEWPGATAEPWLVGVPDPYDGAEGDPYHRWSLRLPIATAQRLLASLLHGRGSFLGIRILEHGTSPRVIWAAVQGTRGSTRVSGLQLQDIFGLRSNWASFTTISTQATAGASSGSGGAPTRSVSSRSMVAAIGTLVDSLLAEARRSSLHGRVFPATAGSRVSVQKRRRGRWRQLAWARTRRGGYYDVVLPGPGSYRVLYHGLAGETITIP